MKSKLIFLLLGILLLGSFVSAYEPHKQNTDLEFSFTSNNATSCQVTTANTPNGILSINQNSTRNGQTFNNTISSGNFSTLGNYCFNIVCSDGVENTGGNVCRELSPSGKSGTNNLVFTLFIIFAIYAINLLGFFGKNATMTLLGGMALMFLGLYLINNGIVVYRDDLTNYFAYITIAWGVTSAFMAGWSLYQDL